MIRQPIICVMGHVDHGKTTLLDRIRSTAIASKEAGGITQHIGASEVPIKVIREISGALLKSFKGELKIPGLLFIDTPGHEAFTNLRRRGGAVADLAILVVDVSKGFEPQTYEAIEILKQYKTPFIVAANKIDLINGWRSNKTYSVLESLKSQSQAVADALDSRIYSLIGKLSELGFGSERFDRVNDFKKELVIVPVSAKTGEGIAELLVYVAGLAQRFLEARLDIEVKGPGRGSILEKKEEIGLGTTIDIILYSGTLKVGDTVAFSTAKGIRTAKIKALLKPKPLHEIRESASRFDFVDEVNAASGVKVSAPGLEEALPGSLICSTHVSDYAAALSEEIKEVFEVDKSGIVLKADTIGTIEALSRLLKSNGVSISKKGIGNVTKKDVLDAFAMRAIDPYSSVVLAFNVQVEEDAAYESAATGVKIINDNVIYQVIDDYKAWLENAKQEEKALALKSVTLPAKISVLPNAVFRVSKPAIFGIEVLVGRLEPSSLLMDEHGDIIGRLKEMQSNGIRLDEAKAGQEAAVSIDGITFGRQVREGDVLYTFLNDDEERLLKTKFSYLLSSEERDLLDELSKIKAAGRNARR
ncbi:MAG: translation initiation factor IF-2 [Candidatus Micrarchaeaceae archaeon]